MAARPVLRAPALGALALALTLTGCGVGANRPDTTATTLPDPTCTVPGAESVTRGEGRIPASVPGDLPIPSGAVVGSTVIDRAAHRTELTLSVGREADVVVQYYTVSLVSAGFVVDRSTGDPSGWRIEFSRGELRGSLVVRSVGGESSAVEVRLNTC